MWAWFNWLLMGISDRLLLQRWWTIGFHTVKVSSLSATDLQNDSVSRGVRRAMKDKVRTHLEAACLHLPVVLGGVFSVPRTIVSRSDHSLISDAGRAKGKKWKGIAPSSGCLKHVLQHTAPTIIKLAREFLATATHLRFEFTLFRRKFASSLGGDKT